MGSKKEHMLLNINKSPRLYKTLEGGVVQNDYIFVFTNTDAKEHIYYFEIIGNDKIKIKRPIKAFKIGAGKQSKEIVILETSEALAEDTRKDIPVPIKIRAYAIDEKVKIVVDRQAVFIYPRADLIRE